MGMFDYLRCEMPLPQRDGVPDRGWSTFQTKDTPDQLLNLFTIRADGSLSVKRDEQTMLLTDFSGEICFYDLEGGAWWEYVARFTDGKCAEIKFIEYRDRRGSHHLDGDGPPEVTR